ncbi:MAG: hypothetical protein A2525_12225 [Sulfurimonas sp. RIFOXYD12_FULL_36_11]|nr:MAG: hypothetical protein A2525_12225 [Sulfurimonas sp. RIFOXYD12_FULL_36_11]
MKIVAGILTLLFTLFGHEHTDSIKADILEKVFTNISINKEIIIWSDNENLILEFKAKANFATASKCGDAYLLILENKQNIDKECQEKAIFVMNYALLKEIPQSFGAIFWKKGRPNIVIIAPRAKARSIKISEKLDDYLEEKIW